MEIYLDNSATTAVHPDVVKLMSKIMLEDYGNPSSKHKRREFRRSDISTRQERHSRPY